MNISKSSEDDIILKIYHYLSTVKSNQTKSFPIILELPLWFYKNVKYDGLLIKNANIAELVSMSGGKKTILAVSLGEAQEVEESCHVLAISSPNSAAKELASVFSQRPATQWNPDQASSLRLCFVTKNMIQKDIAHCVKE